MKNLINAKKLSREEMKAIHGGVTQAECFNNCSASATAQCNMYDPMHQVPDCYYQYYQDCATACVCTVC